MNNNQLLDEIGKRYQRALVTGGAGFIGSHVCEELVKSDIEVISLDDFVNNIVPGINLKQNPGALTFNSNIAKMNLNITIEKLSSERKTIVQSLIKFCQT